MAEVRKFIENIQAVLGVGYIPGSGSIEQQKAIALSLISSLPKDKERLKAISQQNMGEGISLARFRDVRLSEGNDVSQRQIGRDTRTRADVQLPWAFKGASCSLNEHLRGSLKPASGKSIS